MIDFLKDPSRKFNAGFCLACNAPMTGITGPAGGVPDGAVMICAICSHAMQWDGTKVIELTPELMEELKLDESFKKAAMMARLFQEFKKGNRPKVIMLEPLEPEKCEECGKIDECRPYGKRKANGVRKWVCFSCARKDEKELSRAFDERMEGKNPTFPGEGQ
jgi:hypothetical protein